MRGLLSRLSELDAGMGDAVRIIAFFDELVSRGASPDMLVRSAAALAECPVGLVDLRGGPRLRYGPDGEVPPEDDRPDPAPTGLPAASAVCVDGRLVGPVLRDGAVTGLVWLERTAMSAGTGEDAGWNGDAGGNGGAGGDAYGPDEELLVERLAHAAAVVLERVRPRTAAPAGPASLAALVARSTGDEERATTLRGLGLAAERTVTLLAVRSAGPLPETLTRLAGPGGLAGSSAPCRSTVLGDVGLLLVTGAAPAGLGPDADPGCVDPALAGVRIGVGPAVPALRAHESWAAARLALRFAGPPEASGPPVVVRHDGLGALALLARVPAGLVAADADVAAVARLADTAGAPSDLTVLAAVCGAASLREAAAGLHLHHSSVAHRVRRIERSLGYALDSPDGRTRARVALLLHRLHGTS
ncbi:helix-turn-helix domain-containing protein [Streptomyces sp. NPDC053493]|uniref:helix-turn-helix domain-containing protein n=1 Tax=Streptomyces sp. NPDC053493 TaxID=3365705 RepID=UPI0037D85F2D